MNYIVYAILQFSTRAVTVFCIVYACLGYMDLNRTFHNLDGCATVPCYFDVKSISSKIDLFFLALILGLVSFRLEKYFKMKKNLIKTKARVKETYNRLSPDLQEEFKDLK
jgi:hypothetical protein